MALEEKYFPATQVITGVSSFVAIVPADTDLASYTRAIYCGTSGDVGLKLVDDSIVVLKNLAGGVWHPIAGVKQIRSTGTTALDIVASLVEQN